MNDLQLFYTRRLFSTLDNKRNAMTVSDSSTLSALIAAYDKAVVFEESVPNAFRLAKLFPEMGLSNGGLVLLGVRQDGRVSGVQSSDLDSIYSRFENLCSDLTTTRVEIGTLRFTEKTVVFLVFNPVPRNLRPLDRYSDDISRVELV